MAIPVVIFFGATASGKTDIASKIFSYNQKNKFLNTDFYSSLSGRAEIISSDSIQVYKKLNIGSASPSQELLDELPHHLIAIKDPKEEFSVSDFVISADKLCAEIFSRKKLPVLLGGTAFFLKNFAYGLPVTPKADPKIRASLQERAKKEGAVALLEELSKIDPKTAERLHINDEYRIIRALEVFAATGKPLSEYKLSETYREGYDFFVLSIDRPRETLYNRIEQRVDQMIEEGLVAEVKSLYQSGYTCQDPALKAIGYREFFLENGQLKEEKDLPEIINLIKRNTKRYAKRQETFFKAIPNVHHYNVEQDEEILRLYKDIEAFYSKYFKP